MIDLDNLRKLEAAATPGPWRVDHDRNEQACIYAGEGTDEWVALLPHQCVASIEEARNHDAALIAAMRSALPALLDAKRNRSEAERALHSITDAFACRPSDVDDAIAAAHLLVAERDAARAEAARLTRELADSEESAGSWREQAQLVAAEVARLRGLVERACDALDSSTPDWGTGPKTWRSAAIRKEAAGE